MKDEAKDIYFEEPVTRSRTMLGTTVVLILLLVALIFFWSTTDAPLCVILVIFGVILVPAIWLMPVKLGAGDGEFYIRRLLSTKVIPLERIKEVRAYETSMADGKICALSGFFANIGWYKSWEIGLYFAYIGNFKETFLIVLKPDSKGKERNYVVSCRNHIEVVSKLRDAIGQ